MLYEHLAERFVWSPGYRLGVRPPTRHWALPRNGHMTTDGVIFNTHRVPVIPYTGDRIVIKQVHAKKVRRLMQKHTKRMKPIKGGTTVEKAQYTTGRVANVNHDFRTLYRLTMPQL